MMAHAERSVTGNPIREFTADDLVTMASGSSRGCGNDKTRCVIQRREDVELIFFGNDRSEDHHDVEVQHDKVRCLARRRLPEGVVGVAAQQDLLGELAGEPEEVVVGIETDRACG